MNMILPWSVELVLALALLQYLVFGALVGRARGQYGVQAPAISGHPAFERIYRVQMNTLELLVAFVPALLLAAQHWHALAVAGVGAVYLVGRVLYARAYVANPASRALGFVLSLLPVGVLLLGALLGALRSAV